VRPTQTALTKPEYHAKVKEENSGKIGQHKKLQLEKKKIRLSSRKKIEWKSSADLLLGSGSHVQILCCSFCCQN
jgi:hypothetical protein